MTKPSPLNIGLLSLVFISLVAGIWVFRQPPRYKPTNQAELDMARHQKPASLVFLMPRIFRKEDAYWKSRIGIKDLADTCGKSIDEAIVIRTARAFGDAQVIYIHDAEKIQIRFPGILPMAYIPRSNPSSMDDEGTFNPKAAEVKFVRKVTRLPWWQRKRLAWDIKHTAVLDLPYESPNKEIVLDGGGMALEICSRGLLYRYSRQLGGGKIEPSMENLLKIVSPD